jgi:hypothetical protein
VPGWFLSEKMLRRLIAFIIFTTLLSCSFSMTSKKTVGSKVRIEKESVTVFFTGFTLGQLKPCGCFGGQLGGLEGRPAIFGKADKKRRLIVDTGNFVTEPSEQNLIKYSILVRAFDLLDYDLLNLGKADIENAKAAGLFENIKSLFNTVSSDSDANLPHIWSKSFSANGQNFDVRIFSIDAKTYSNGQNDVLPAEGSDIVNIFILNNCDDNIISDIKKIESIDCIICPGESDNPTLLSEHGERPLLFTVGQLGKYVASLEITPKSEQGFELKFSSIEVSEDLPRDKALVELYSNYQQIVSQSNLLESYPKLVLPAGLEYVGSEQCKTCHGYEYDKWSTKAHAHAYETLEKVGSEDDPECVVCHVVGMDYESGFVTKEITPNLKDVGCENCHGPGSEHVKNYEIPTQEPKMDCVQCHTPEHSADYAGNEEIYMQKIVHWREPNQNADVK